jgi:hypothetical protein
MSDTLGGSDLPPHEALRGWNPTDQEGIDRQLIALDGTPNKPRGPMLSAADQECANCNHPIPTSSVRTVKGMPTLL